MSIEWVVGLTFGGLLVLGCCLLFARQVDTQQARASEMLSRGAEQQRFADELQDRAVTLQRREAELLSRWEAVISRLETLVDRLEPQTTRPEKAREDGTNAGQYRKA